MSQLTAGRAVRQSARPVPMAGPRFPVHRRRPLGTGGLLLQAGCLGEASGEVPADRHGAQSGAFCKRRQGTIAFRQTLDTYASQLIVGLFALEPRFLSILDRDSTTDPLRCTQSCRATALGYFRNGAATSGSRGGEITGGG